MPFLNAPSAVPVGGLQDSRAPNCAVAPNAVLFSMIALLIGKRKSESTQVPHIHTLLTTQSPGISGHG